MQCPESKIQDGGSWIQDPGSWFQDPGSRVLDPGSRIRAPGSSVLDPRSWTQDPGPSTVDPGSSITGSSTLGPRMVDPESHRITYDYVREVLKFYICTYDYVREWCKSVKMLAIFHCKNGCYMIWGSTPTMQNHRFFYRY